MYASTHTAIAREQINYLEAASIKDLCRTNHAGRTARLRRKTEQRGELGAAQASGAAFLVFQ